MGEKEGFNMARYMVSLPESVVAVADKKAKESGISRSAFIASAIQLKADCDEALLRLPRFIEYFDDIVTGKKVAPTHITISADEQIKP